jgi:KipI family sensor histidine kinase inhibitor
LTAYPRVLAVGDAAACVELGDAIDPALSARVLALGRALAAEPLPGQIETVPSYRSLLVFFEPGRADWPVLRDHLLGRVATAGAQAGEPGALHTVPTRYGGEDGPDLASVAQRLDIGEDDLVRLHGASEYTALMLGFMPGFAYLGNLDPRLETPRLSTPRVRVPAGSVAIAARQTGIYPSVSPGGWNLIGRTSLRLFDPLRDPPALILPGDRVRFVASDERPDAEPSSAAPAYAGPAAIEVLEPGLQTSVQDLGRRGYRRLGVGWAGALDSTAARAANALVGNDAGEALLECTLAGPRLRFLSATPFAVTGADLGALLHRTDLGAWPVPLGLRVLARPGNELAFTGRQRGCRAYLAFAGGLDVPRVLGSRSTDLVGGFGGLDGRALRAGDSLCLGPARPRASEVEAWQPPEASTGPARIRVVLGPQDDRIEPASVVRFLAEPYAVAAASNRVGCRLEGERLAHRGSAEILSDGMAPGSIQVPPDGQPIVMLADGPTTGGYPKLATVLSADLPLIAQLVPGVDSVRFEAVALDEVGPERVASRIT